MDFKLLIKKPLIIANVLILFCFIFLPYISMNFGPWGGVSKTGLGLLWSIFDKFQFMNLLLIVVPASSGFIIYKIIKKEEANFLAFKIILLLMHLYLFLHIAFFAEKSDIDFVGFGLWLSLVLSILQLFEAKVVAAINKQLPEDKKLEE
jgi:hypothetical protein